MKIQNNDNMLKAKFCITKWEVGKTYIKDTAGDERAKIKRYLIGLYTFIQFCLFMFIHISRMDVCAWQWGWIYIDEFFCSCGH